MNHLLIQKYNVPGPRYTSYPTVPYWDNDTFSVDKWIAAAKDGIRLAKETGEGISLYIHLPYCESLCTYCGCNTRITVNHKVELPYIESLLKEFAMYQALNKEKIIIREIHLGGGTPTFFSPENLHYLLSSILNQVEIHSDYEFSFEAHPNNTTEAHLQTLYDLGFRRLSLGIQDFDPKVQEIVNRIQSYEQVAKVNDIARKIGYTSINFDLIYGLPLQTLDSVIDTINKVNQLKPDRIAFYSYAHVPWVKPGQRRFTELDLPEDAVKRTLYEEGKKLLEQNGYLEVGMDHFALENDKLNIALKEGFLHRNFMGYTTCGTKTMIGLGVSSISDTWNAFGQNIKNVEQYQEKVAAGEFPVFRGHMLNEEDLVVRRHILNVICKFSTQWTGDTIELEIKEKLQPLIEDNFIELNDKGLNVNKSARAFIRNVCMSFDVRLHRKQPNTQIFSKVI